MRIIIDIDTTSSIHNEIEALAAGRICRWTVLDSSNEGQFHEDGTDRLTEGQARMLNSHLEGK